jgi:hypothetical protein
MIWRVTAKPQQGVASISASNGIQYALRQIKRPADPEVKRFLDFIGQSNT